jgi:hypothetical protein
MDTKIIELRMAVRALPTDNRDVQLAVKSEVLRLAELLDKQMGNPTTGAVDLLDSCACGDLIPADEYRCLNCQREPANH